MAKEHAKPGAEVSGRHANGRAATPPSWAKAINRTIVNHLRAQEKQIESMYDFWSPAIANFTRGTAVRWDVQYGPKVEPLDDPVGRILFGD